MATSEPVAHRQDLDRLPDPARGPKISIIMPTRDGKPQWVRRAIESVRTQSWPCWELCLVDDGSREPETVAMLTQLASEDDRIQLTRLDASQGIAGASNLGLQMATGDVCAFVDHDDLLHTHALALLAVHVTEHPECDVFYSDEDKIDARDRRYRPTFKTAQSAFALWRWNYVCHLLAVRTETLRRHAGFDSTFDGAQDFDLVLRLHQCGTRMHHVPHVLYHWREHPGSTSGGQPAKPGALDATRRALDAALARQNRSVKLASTSVVGAWAFDAPMDPSRDHLTRVIVGTEAASHPTWSPLIRETREVTTDLDWSAALNDSRSRWILAVSDGLEPIEDDTIETLVRAAQTPGVGIVGAKVIDARQRVVDAGAVTDQQGVLRRVYRGASRLDPGYRWALALGMTVSTPPLDAWLVNRDLAARAWIHVRRVHPTWWSDESIPFALRLSIAVSLFSPGRSTVTLGTPCFRATSRFRLCPLDGVTIPGPVRAITDRSIVPNLPAIEPAYLGSDASGVVEVVGVGKTASA